MSMRDYEFHPYASVVPMLGQTELNALAADIQGNGLREPIILLDGKILDGRNRYKACKIVNVTPMFKDFNGDGDPIAFIISMNLCRRQLTASQKAIAVAKILELPRGNPNLQTSKTLTKPNSVQIRNYKTAADVARDVDVSTSTVEQAKRVLRDAPKETIKKVERGEKSVATAVREIRKDKELKVDHRDRTGYPIPSGILEDWQRAEGFRSVLNDLQKVKLYVEKSVDEGDLIFREITNTTTATLKNAWTELGQVLPYAVCPTCQGRTRDKCTLCKQRGFISKFGYEHWIPKKTRELREKGIRK